MRQRAKEIEQETSEYIDPAKREYLPNFFETGKGQYGGDDKFLGAIVPNTRLVAKWHEDAPLDVTAELLQSQRHKYRLCTLLMLVERFKKSDKEKRKRIYDFYSPQTSRINNQDSVDLSVPGIVGEYLRDRPREDLYRLAGSELFWDQRIAAVSTHTLIKNGDFIDILVLSEQLLYHPHDLMREAIDWILREMRRRDKDLLVQFLGKYCKAMSRTMLCCVTEKLPEEERKEFMKH